MGNGGKIPISKVNSGEWESPDSDAPKPPKVCGSPPGPLVSSLFCGRAVQYNSRTVSPSPGATVDERSSEAKDSPLYEDKMSPREIPMKWLAVAMMLAGSMVAQTKQISEAAVTPPTPTINIGI